MRIYAEDELRTLMPRLALDANKYTRGKLVLAAGSAAYPGAACLAAFAAQRAGAGYVEVVCAPESVGVVQGARPSLVVRSWDAFDPAALTADTRHPRACVVGPGFEGNDAWQRSLVLRVVDAAEAPVLVDGGALSALASAEGLAYAHRRATCGRALVLTPHGGEAARLARAARVEPPATPADAASASVPGVALTSAVFARDLARAYRCIVALKGPDTFVSDGTVVAAVTEGTAVLAKAGTGDVLAGVIGSLLAQGVDPFGAAVLGATLHARAGCAAAARVGEVSVVPEDVIDALPHVLRALS